VAQALQGGALGQKNVITHKSTLMTRENNFFLQTLPIL
jgi:hypothetical protein